MGLPKDTWVYLASPYTVAASAVTGRITDANYLGNEDATHDC
jgi:homoaconitase/3-isopropylmalate dehydratase large subunit